MKFEIDLPSNCDECVFCEESVFCGLLYGEPIYQSDEDYGCNKRARFCPFDNKDKRNEMHEGVRIIENMR